MLSYDSISNFKNNFLIEAASKEVILFRIDKKKLRSEFSNEVFSSIEQKIKMQKAWLNQQL
jgi:hypothetical protein